MDAIIYTEDGQEYEMLSGILMDESPGIGENKFFIQKTFKSYTEKQEEVRL